MIYSRLLNMELALSRNRPRETENSGMCLGLPLEGIERPNCDDEDVALCSSGEDESESALSRAGDGAEQEVLDAEDEVDDRPENMYPPVAGKQCGRIPTTGLLHDWLGKPSNLGRRSAESRYAEDFAKRAEEASIDAAGLPQNVAYVTSDGRSETNWNSSSQIYVAIP